MDMSTMTSMMDLFNEVHLDVLLQIFSFLKSGYNGVTVFHVAEHEMDQTQFPIGD